MCLVQVAAVTGLSTRVVMSRRPGGNAPPMETTGAYQEHEKLRELHEEEERMKLRMLQADAGLIGGKDLLVTAERMDWMYLNPAQAKKEKEDEEYLLGKSLSTHDERDEMRKRLGAGTVAAGSLFLTSLTAQNDDTLRRLREDPLFTIRQAEHQQRRRELAREKVAQSIAAAKAAKAKEEKKRRKREEKERRRRELSSREASLSRDKHRRPHCSSDRPLRVDEDRDMRCRERYGVSGRRDMSSFEKKRNPTTPTTRYATRSSRGAAADCRRSDSFHRSSRNGRSRSPFDSRHLEANTARQRRRSSSRYGHTSSSYRHFQRRDSQTTSSISRSLSSGRRSRRDTWCPERNEPRRRRSGSLCYRNRGTSRQRTLTSRGSSVSSDSHTKPIASMHLDNHSSRNSSPLPPPSSSVSRLPRGPVFPREWKEKLGHQSEASQEQKLHDDDDGASDGTASSLSSSSSDAIAPPDAMAESIRALREKQSAMPLLWKTRGRGLPAREDQSNPLPRDREEREKRLRDMELAGRQHEVEKDKKLHQLSKIEQLKERLEAQKRMAQHDVSHLSSRRATALQEGSTFIRDVRRSAYIGDATTLEERLKRYAARRKKAYVDDESLLEEAHPLPK